MSEKPTTDELIESTGEAVKAVLRDRNVPLDFWSMFNERWKPLGCGHSISRSFYRVRPAPATTTRPYTYDELVPLVGTAVRLKGNDAVRLIMSAFRHGSELWVELSSHGSILPLQLLSDYEHLGPPPRPCGVEETP